MTTEVILAFTADDVSFACDEASGPEAFADWRLVISATASVEDDTLGDAILVLAPRPDSVAPGGPSMGAMRKTGRGKFRADVLLDPGLADRIHDLLARPLEIEGEVTLTLGVDVDFEVIGVESEVPVTRVDVLVHRDS
jgi:hypothetical protein